MLRDMFIDGMGDEDERLIDTTRTQRAAGLDDPEVPDDDADDDSDHDVDEDDDADEDEDDEDAD